MLPSRNRLKKKTDIERVLKMGRSFKEGFLVFKILKTDLSKMRFGFIVPKKISKKATVRNRIKRKLGEIIRSKLKKINLTEGSAEKGIDGLLIATPGLENKDFWEIEEAIGELFSKGKI